VRPKQFQSLWYVQRKSCTYLASRLALSPNSLNWASIWASSPWSIIGCVQNDLWAYDTFGANSAPILHRHKHCLQTDRNEISHDPCNLGVPSGAPQWFLSLRYVQPKPCIHLVLKLGLSPNGANQGSSWALSPRSTILGVQNYSEPMVHLVQTMHLFCTETNTISNGPKWHSTWPTSPRSSIGCTQNDFSAYGTFNANRAPILRQD
jgi:hypothetical protein